MTGLFRARRELGLAAGPALEGMALQLLQDLGRRGYSSIRSYRATLDRPAEGRAPDPTQTGQWNWLLERNLVRFLEVPVLDTRMLTAVHLTATGRRYLRQRHLPLVPGEIETLLDRLGHSLKPHYGQALLLAHLARHLGYATAHGVQVPHRRAVADLRLERSREVLFVSLESGLKRKGHPLDRWHVLAQAQPFLPLVAADAETLDTAFHSARQRICQIRGAVLPDLESRLYRGARTLWCRRYNRFEQSGPDPGLAHRQAHLVAAATCQGRLRQAFRTGAMPGPQRGATE